MNAVVEALAAVADRLLAGRALIGIVQFLVRVAERRVARVDRAWDTEMAKSMAVRYALPRKKGKRRFSSL